MYMKLKLILYTQIIFMKFVYWIYSFLIKYNEAHSQQITTQWTFSTWSELLKMQEDGMKFSDPYILSAIEVAKEERKTRQHIEK